jgi:hypothetical protein
MRLMVGFWYHEQIMQKFLYYYFRITVDLLVHVCKISKIAFLQILKNPAAPDKSFYTVHWYGSHQFYQIHDRVGSLFGLTVHEDGVY